MSCVSRLCLHNGLNIILKYIANNKITSCGIWVDQGSKDENLTNNGISHLTEHLMFKVNSKNSAYSMESDLESLKFLGCKYNGITTKDHTCFYIDGMYENINKMLEVLSYIVINKCNVPSDILEKEKQIVLREAEEYLASSRQIGERVGQALWGEQNFGLLSIGNPVSIKNISNKMIDNLVYSSYIPKKCTLVIVGDFKYDDVLEKININFSSWNNNPYNKLDYTFKSNSRIFVDSKFLGSRSTIGLGLPAYSSNNFKNRYAEILKDILVFPGFKLFKEIREKKGLVYSLSGFCSSFSKAGNLGITFSANNKYISDIVKIFIEQFNLLINKGIDEHLLQNVKAIKKTELLYKFESTSSQLMILGKSNIRGHFFLLENELKNIDKINKEVMDEVIKELFITNNLAIAVLGNTDIKNIISTLKI